MRKNDACVYVGMYIHVHVHVYTCTMYNIVIIMYMYMYVPYRRHNIPTAWRTVDQIGSVMREQFTYMNKHYVYIIMYTSCVQVLLHTYIKIYYKVQSTVFDTF